MPWANNTFSLWIIMEMINSPWLSHTVLADVNLRRYIKKQVNEIVNILDWMAIEMKEMECSTIVAHSFEAALTHHTNPFERLWQKMSFSVTIKTLIFASLTIASHNCLHFRHFFLCLQNFFSLISPLRNTCFCLCSFSNGSQFQWRYQSRKYAQICENSTQIFK